LEEDGVEFLADGGEGVLDLGGDLGVDLAGDDAVALELAELVGEHPLGDVGEELSELSEAAGSGEEVVEDHALPAAAEGVEEGLDGAGVVAVVGALVIIVSLGHVRISSQFCLWYQRVYYCTLRYVLVLFKGCGLERGVVRELGFTRNGATIMAQAKAYAAASKTSPLAPWSFARREPLASDVEIEILYCGVCHSDLHTARGEWDAFWPTVYPNVPGHEIVGRVRRVGSGVRGFKVGQLAAVGCMVDSCRECASCREGLEQYCERGMVGTYNAPDAHGAGPVTYGGYSSEIVVDEKYVLHVSEKLDLAAVAPLLCAGITLWSPLKHWGAGPGKKVGIVGLGGLGHMGVKFAHALGAETVLFTTSESKVADGRRLGADQVVISKNAAEMAKHARSFDLIVNTVAASHSLDPFVSLLKRDGALVLVGAPEHPHPSPTVFNLLVGRRSIAGSAIGGIAETQEMLDYCAEKNIVSEIELIPAAKINEAYERMLKSDVKYRFVIDMKTL
jgi:uncharacterized zinc-type alcohol dehydrogenase-like protein